ncbi:hypothetical protein RO3G_00994 [Rhizopus delemar RA 99-880]|uniref:Homeobox domain-containing protein n=1 Tax=Rhizopus delemar (strain RA 99-880 / ATCC MYA-4621 / FGSC 9543 / NRRL 43880) TaxID=246409 RepID=I1BJB0_RHIO9|nr:hypothetical protein RO3G_00994 [Rhizopus delemar RA 99-880]|eukprot:EIE76290.1 hypothetical protein RO3G_00994 [Rhizopus delemar RA 99-880]
MSTLEKKKLRTFSPVILFHDHQYVEAGDIHHIHIPYNDKRQLDLHKKRINEMLEINDHPEPHSPVPSLVLSPSPPPVNKHMTGNNKRRRGNLPKAVTAILRDWLCKHKKHPYPTEEEKAQLASETNLNLNQIKQTLKKRSTIQYPPSLKGLTRRRS